MKCARLNLQERSKPPSQVLKLPKMDKPRRYCQKRMVNPEHCEDPQWVEVLKKYNNCNPEITFEENQEYEQNPGANGPVDDMFLTVQNLKFQGDVMERKRPKTSFKFKSLTSNKTHRMFIKQVIEDTTDTEDDRRSELSNYYFDDYVKYINADRSRPSSSKSNVFLQDLTKVSDDKSTQVEIKPNEVKKTRKVDLKIKKSTNKNKDEKEVNNNVSTEEMMQDTKVTYQKTGKKKSLTISRAQSPETIQVIRVDVVCNYSSSSVLSNYEDEKLQSDLNLGEKDIQKIKFKTPHFADKYLLTNTMKSVNERLTCGSKVTLLCKTFKLSDRSKLSEKKYKLVKECSPKMSIRNR